MNIANIQGRTLIDVLAPFSEYFIVKFSLNVVGVKSIYAFKMYFKQEENIISPKRLLLNFSKIGQISYPLVDLSTYLLWDGRKYTCQLLYAHTNYS